MPGRGPADAGWRRAAGLPLPPGARSRHRWRHRSRRRRERCRATRRRPARAPVAGATFPHPREVPELDFAAVRPGFVAACIVEAAGARRGRRARPGGPGRFPPHRHPAGRRGARSPLPAPGGRPHGVSLSRDHPLRYRIHRNRQMEHLTQVAVGLRGGVRRGAAITARERAAARDLGLTTFSDKASV